LAVTAIPRESDFNILLQNCVERQSGYERHPVVKSRPPCHVVPYCHPSSAPGCSLFLSILPEWLATLYSAPGDVVLIRTKRRASNRLGFAVQLCALRHPGGVLDPTV
jgi:hypothetical protein